MKIQYALMSCSANPHYTEYWPIVAAAWLKLDVTPVCLFIPDNPSVTLPDAPGGIVHTIPHLNDVHIIIQTSMVRFWASCLYPKAIVTATDIDLVPLSTHFFNTQLAPYPEDVYLHLRALPGEYDLACIANIPETISYVKNMRWLGVSWHIARGEVMHQVLEFTPDWATSCRKTIPYFLRRDAKETDLKVVGRRPFTALNPSLGDEIYPSIRLHHATYRPISYHTYSPDLCRGIMNYVATAFTQYEPKSNYSSIHFSVPYSATKELIEHALAGRPLPRLYLIFRWLIEDLTEILNKKIKIVGPYLSFISMFLTWLGLRLIYPFVGYSKMLLGGLWHTRNDWLQQHPLLLGLYRRWLRVRSFFISLRY